MTHCDNLAERLPFGYCISPNNIHGVDGVLIYAGGPGIPEPPAWNDEIILRPDGTIEVGRFEFEGERYVRGRHVWKLAHRFSGPAAFALWCAEHGRLSEPGLPAFSQGTGWD